MSDMVERVAVALIAELQRQAQERQAWMDKTELTSDGGVVTEAWSLDGQFDLRKGARAAIEAMREPTEAMLAAGQWTISDNLTVSVCVENNRKAGKIFRAMIDAALKPKP